MCLVSKNIANKSSGERAGREGIAEDCGRAEQEDHHIFILHVRNIPSSAVLRGKVDGPPAHLHHRRVSFYKLWRELNENFLNLNNLCKKNQ